MSAARAAVRKVSLGVKSPKPVSTPSNASAPRIETESSSQLGLNPGKSGPSPEALSKWVRYRRSYPDQTVSQQRFKAPGPSSSWSPKTPQRYSNASGPLGALTIPSRDSFSEEGPRFRGRRQSNGGKGFGDLKRGHDGRERAHTTRTTSFFGHHATLKISKKQKKIIVKSKVQKDVYIPKNITVANLARLLGVQHKHLQRTMESNGMTNTNSDYMLSSDDAYILAIEFNRNPIVDEEAAFDIYPSPSPSDKSVLPPRPPVITIMGHVDHGKTTLLDTLRSASVASGEAGGITQHIGAFSVPVRRLTTSNVFSIDSMHTITFLDTPGHAAFTAMRSRGAHVTDIIVLVVAADDGIMPQTREVIALAKQSKLSGEDAVGLVVALNKMDKPGADPTHIKHALLAEGVELEEFGGDVPCVEVSGLTGMGLDRLVETLATLAEIKELRARVEGPAEGRVLESRVDKGRGPVATVLVTNGTLSSGSCIVAGTTWARLRQMMDSTGKPIRCALPGIPVTVSGWKELPQAGDEVLEGKEDDVKITVRNRKRNIKMRALQADVELINEKRAEAREEAAAVKAGLSDSQTVNSNSSKPSDVKELRLIVKADVSGSVEALVGSITGIGNDLAKVRIIQAGAGEPTTTDVDMAKTLDAMILGFSVQPSNKVFSYASSQGVSIKSECVIYRIIDLVRSKVQELLPPVLEYRVLGEALVLQLFQIHGKQKGSISVAGCRVTNGIIEKHKKVRIFRGQEEIYTGSLDSLKQIKKDIVEARKGLECGMSLTNFTDFREGDRIQTYEVIERPGQL